jgi:aryl-alcohol dehydrogenase-like predicted oxidoreductase
MWDYQWNRFSPKIKAINGERKTMNKIPFGKTGEMVSQYSLGCMVMGSQTDRVTSFEMLDRFMAAGGNFLDTANCYAWWLDKNSVGDESETLLGEWMRERGNRNQIFLATKGGARLKDVNMVRNAQGEINWAQVPHAYEYLSANTIRKAVEGSLRRLQTDHIDLYYAHIDDRVTPLEETLGALNELVVEGKLRYIACSNLRTWRLERARNISAAHGWSGYVGVQQQYSYLRPKPGANFGVGVNVDDELLDYLRVNTDVTLMAYSPLLKGIYDDAQKRAAYYNWSLFNSDDARARLEVLSRMARELNVSNSQLVMAWLLHHQPRVIPIVGARTLEQYEVAMQALNIHLTDEQLSTLNAASA